VETLLKIVRV